MIVRKTLTYLTRFIFIFFRTKFTIVLIAVTIDGCDVLRIKFLTIVIERIKKKGMEGKPFLLWLGVVLEIGPIIRSASRSYPLLLSLPTIACISIHVWITFCQQLTRHTRCPVVHDPGTDILFCFQIRSFFCVTLFFRLAPSSPTSITHTWLQLHVASPPQWSFVCWIFILFQCAVSSLPTPSSPVPLFVFLSAIASNEQNKRRFSNITNK